MKYLCLAGPRPGPPRGGVALPGLSCPSPPQPWELRLREQGSKWAQRRFELDNSLVFKDLRFQEPLREAKDLRQVLPEEPVQLPAGGGEGLGHLGLLQRGMRSGGFRLILVTNKHLSRTHKIIWEISLSQYGGGGSKEAATPSKKPERAPGAKPDSH